MFFQINFKIIQAPEKQIFRRILWRKTSITASIMKREVSKPVSWSVVYCVLNLTSSLFNDLPVAIRNSKVFQILKQQYIVHFSKRFAAELRGRTIAAA